MIVGKNNCGKTSLLSILNKCIGNKSETGIFEYYDFSIPFQKKLYKIIKSEVEFNENELNGIRVDIIYRMKIPTILLTLANYY